MNREIGGAMSEYYPNCKPKMEDYDVNVRADVLGYRVIVGTQINVQDLSKERHFLRYRNAVTVKVRRSKCCRVLLKIPSLTLFSYHHNRLIR